MAMPVIADTPSATPIMIKLVEPGEDRELKALSYIGSILSDFDDEAKRRMLAYLNLRYDGAS